ncbi:MAG: hypothetical protein AAF914_08740 [Pseudomonadota bacterium]
MNATSHFRHFLRSEHGAVTVDWVVLSSATLGLGLAVTAVIFPGIQSVATEASDGIEATPITTRFAVETSLFSSDFSDGAIGWLGGAVASLSGFGDVLQLGPGEMASLTLDVPPGASSASLSFDMIGGDDLSGEPATIMINGQAVAIYADDHGNITTSDLSGSGVSVSVTQHDSNTPIGAGSHGHDSRATYVITVDDPGATLTLGVHSGADEHIGNEFYALDNVSVTAE